MNQQIEKQIVGVRRFQLQNKSGNFLMSQVLATVGFLPAVYF